MAHSIAYSPSGELIATGLLSGIISVWKVAIGDRLMTVDREDREIILLRFLTETRLITGDYGVWQLAATTGEELFEYQVAGKSLIGFFALSPSRKTLLVATSGSVENYLLDAESGRIIQKIDADGIMGAISADDRLAAIEDGWGDALLNSLADGSRLRRFKSPGGGDPHTTVDISPDGKYVLTAPYGDVNVWATDTGMLLNRLHHPGSWACFSPDSGTIACLGWDGMIRLWDFRAGQVVRELDLSQPLIDHSSIMFSPDGTRLLVGFNGNTTVVLEIETGRELLRIDHSSGTF